jgi:hypothetical protein
MRFLAILLVLFTARVDAAVLTDCITLVNGAVLTATGTGTIVPLSAVERIHNIEKMSAVLSVTNNSGTTPTLSMSLDTCESDIAGTCRSMGFTFTTCTTGTCSENIDFNASSVNYWSHFRANYTLAGTSPNYTVTLRICHN